MCFLLECCFYCLSCELPRPVLFVLVKSICAFFSLGRERWAASPAGGDGVRVGAATRAISFSWVVSLLGAFRLMCPRGVVCKLVYVRYLDGARWIWSTRGGRETLPFVICNVTPWQHLGFPDWRQSIMHHSLLFFFFFPTTLYFLGAWYIIIGCGLHPPLLCSWSDLVRIIARNFIGPAETLVVWSRDRCDTLAGWGNRPKKKLSRWPCCGSPHTVGFKRLHPFRHQWLSTNGCQVQADKLPEACTSVAYVTHTIACFFTGGKWQTFAAT